MSKLPKFSHLPKPTFTRAALNIVQDAASSVTQATSSENKAPTQTTVSNTGTIPKMLPKVGSMRPLPKRTGTLLDAKPGPLKALNRAIVPESTTRTALKRPCPSVSDVKAKISRPNVKLNAAPTVKTGRKSLSRQSLRSAAPKRPKPAPYDYKARFGLLQEKHTKTVEALNNVKEELKIHIEKSQQCQIFEDNLNSAKTELEQLKKEIVTQKHKISTLEPKLKATEKELDKCNEDLANARIKNQTLSFEHKKLSEENVCLEKQCTELTTELSYNKGLVEEYRQTTQEFDLERRKLHNIIQDLKGNIRVFCRIRPPLPSEDCRLQYTTNYIDECTLEIKPFKDQNDSIRNRSALQQFSFDQVFSEESTQEEVFLELSQLVQSVLDGYNVCVFAYGQTGSGKTYTMEGLHSEKTLGMIPRAIDLIFNSQEAAKKIGWNYTVSACFLEIYNEKIHDLLDLKNSNLDIRMTDSKGSDIYVTNLTIQNIRSSAELKKYLAIAQRNRAVAATENNERSSRSHSVVKIQVEGVNTVRNERIKSCLNLVDLAGSEKVQTKGTDRLEETKNINKSLATLSHVILSLKEKNDHIPFRNSKLTHLLMPSLGGNSKTLMLVNIAPFEDCFTESVNSLRFATNVNQCKIGTVKKNKVKV